MNIKLTCSVDDPEIKRGGANDGEVLEVEEVKANALIRAGMAVPHIEAAVMEIPKPRYQKKGKIETPEG